MQDKSIALN